MDISVFKSLENLLKEFVILVVVPLLEEHTKYSNLAALSSLRSVSAAEVNKMDFCGVMVTFNSVLRRRVEVELKRPVFTPKRVISVYKVQLATIFIDWDLPRVIMMRHFTIGIRLKRIHDLVNVILEVDVHFSF